MSAQRGPRTGSCDPAHAKLKLEHAKSFLDAADQAVSSSVAASLAVLAGIAASDAACCAVLRQRARGQDHRQTAELLRRLHPDGVAMARDLERLLAVKDDAHYGLLDVAELRADAALRQARRLVEAAAKHVLGLA